MPRYEYECSGCNKTTERVLKISESDTIQYCDGCECGVELKKVFSATPGRVEGAVPFRDSRAVDYIIKKYNRRA